MSQPKRKPRRRPEPEVKKTTDKVVCMKPECQGKKAYVYGDGVARKFKCTKCGHKFE